MTLSIIAAVAQNGTIGANGALPWHIPEDLRYFRTTTMGHPVIMGRATFESVGKPLPGRPTIVVTSRPEGLPPTAIPARSLDEALAAAGRLAGSDEVFVVGGAVLYRAALSLADRLYLTRIDRDYPGDTVFPPFDLAEWQRIVDDRRAGDGHGIPPFSFEIYERSGAR